MLYRWTKDTPFCKAGTELSYRDEQIKIYIEQTRSAHGYTIPIARLIAEGWLVPADKPMMHHEKCIDECIDECIDACTHYYCTIKNATAISSKPMTKTWETLGKSGEVEYVKNRGCDKQAVLARIEDVVLISRTWDYKLIEEWVHIESLKRQGYTIVQPEPETILRDDREPQDIMAQTIIELVTRFDHENNKEEPWKPQDGEEHYYIDAIGEVVDDTWENCDVDKKSFDAGNVWRTKEAALEAAKKTKALWRSLRK